MDCGKLSQVLRAKRPVGQALAEKIVQSLVVKEKEFSNCPRRHHVSRLCVSANRSARKRLDRLPEHPAVVPMRRILAHWLSFRKIEL
jgi:hypothetical protein